MEILQLSLHIFTVSEHRINFRKMINILDSGENIDRMHTVYSLYLIWKMFYGSLAIDDCVFW